MSKYLVVKNSIRHVGHWSSRKKEKYDAYLKTISDYDGLSFTDEIIEVRKTRQWNSREEAEAGITRLITNAIKRIEGRKSDYELSIKNGDSDKYIGQRIGSCIYLATKLAEELNHILNGEDGWAIKEVDIDDFPVILTNKGKKPSINKNGSKRNCMMCGVMLHKIPFVDLKVNAKTKLCPICVHTLYDNMKGLIDTMDPEHVKSIKRSRFLEGL
jgi:hypothetical protein